jgi:hypothetical protein
MSRRTMAFNLIRLGEGDFAQNETGRNFSLAGHLPRTVSNIIALVDLKWSRYSPCMHRYTKRAQIDLLVAVAIFQSSTP